MEKAYSSHKDNAAEPKSGSKKINSAEELKRSRKTVPRDAPPQRSSVHRGVTRHRWTGRFEAHLWDKNCWNESRNKKGRQVYLGAYDDEDAAAHAYDLAALKYWGSEAILNFPLSIYEEDLKEMEGQSKEEYLGTLRRKSSGFSRGVSKYRGVARHNHNGRWEARIGRLLGNKYLYLGTYATQEEAATAYDMAAIEFRGPNAVTNFDLSRYMQCIPPGQNGLPSNNSDHLPDSTPPQGAGASASFTLGLLLQSSKFMEMMERTSAEDCPATSSLEPKFHQRSFPDDIQTFFGCQEPGGFAERDDGIFGYLNSFASPFFHCELDD